MITKQAKIPLWQKFAVPISFLILFFLAANFTDCDLVTFWKRREPPSLYLVVDTIPPDFFLYSENLAATFFYTIQMSVTGTVLGTFFCHLYSRLLALQT